MARDSMKWRSGPFATMVDAGLCGVQMNTALVRGVTRARMSSRSVW